MLSQGAKAKKEGAQLESLCKAVFSTMGMEFTSQAKFTGLYNTASKMDFYLPSLDCAVECKRQNKPGTTDEKIPFVVETLARFPARRGLLILDGIIFEESKPGLIEYLCTKQSEVFDWCFFYELEDWLGGQ